MSDPTIVRTGMLAHSEAFDFEVLPNHVVITLKPFAIKMEFTYAAFETFRAAVLKVDLTCANRSRLQ